MMKKKQKKKKHREFLEADRTEVVHCQVLHKFCNIVMIAKNGRMGTFDIGHLGKRRLTNQMYCRAEEAQAHSPTSGLLQFLNF